MYTSYVYLLSDGLFYKIGFSNNIEARIKSLQTGNPKKITFVAKATFTSSIKGVANEKASQYETDLHEKYAPFSETGEWFSLSENHVDELKNDLNGIKEIKLRTKDRILKIIKDKFGDKPNKIYENEIELKEYLKRPKNRQCLKTFREEFLSDSEGNPLNLDRKIGELDAAPSEIWTKTHLGKVPLWVEAFSFTQGQAKNFIWLHYAISCRFKNSSEHSIQKQVPNNITIRQWLEL